DGAALQGEAKVDDPDPPAIALFANEHVGRTKVAVQQALAVSRPHGPRNRDNYSQELRRGQRAALLNELLQRPAREIVQDEIRPLALIRRCKTNAAGAAKDRVGERGEQLRLAEDVIGIPLQFASGQRLDHDGLSAPRILAEEGDAESARSQDALWGI